MKTLVNVIVSFCWGFSVTTLQSHYWVLESIIMSVVIFQFLEKIDSIEERLNNRGL